MNNLAEIVSQFEIKATINAIKAFGGGLINDTYKVTTKEQDQPQHLQECGHATK